jgi:hypothetical protein
MTTSRTIPFRETADYQSLVAALVLLPSGSVPRARAVNALMSIADQYDNRIRIINLVQEALAQLRLDIKYLHFDLEATRRERDTYRQRLDDGETNSP